jgi:hypothetical protein
VGAFATAAWPVVRAFVTGLGPGLMAGIAPLQSMVTTLMSGGVPSAATLALIARAASGLGQALGFAVGTIAAFVGGVGLIATTVMGLGATFTGLVSSLILPIRTAFVSIGGAIVNVINNVLVPVLFAIAFIVFIWGAFKTFIIGATTEEVKKEGKSLMLWGLIGFFVMVSVWGLVNILINTVGFGNNSGITTPKAGVQVGGFYY